MCVGGGGDIHKSVWRALKVEKAIPISSNTNVLG